MSIPRQFSEGEEVVEQPDGGDGLVDAQAPPMNATLMGRLFVVPALIVCVMLGVAVVVVLFGASSLGEQQTIDDLLTRIEADSGERTLGMLLPGAKESWQAAQELARRLESEDEVLTSQEIQPVAERIIRILEPSRDVGAGSGGGRKDRGADQRLFLIAALGRLGTPLAIEPLAALLRDEDIRTRQAALQALAGMRRVPETERILPEILPLLNDPEPAVQMIACLTVAALSDRGNLVAVQAVAERLEADREIQWNAATALARMGSKRGKLVLMNMLDRGHWEEMVLDYVDGGTQVRRRLTPTEVSQRLCVAVTAVSYLDDEELTALVVKLRDDDASHQVREAARKACE